MPPRKAGAWLPGLALASSSTIGQTDCRADRDGKVSDPSARWPDAGAGRTVAAPLAVPTPAETGSRRVPRLPRHDARRHRGLAARRIEKAIPSPTHDAADNACVGLTADAEPATFDDQGRARDVRRRIDRLPGPHETTRRLGPVPRTALAAHGGGVAILDIRRSSVTHPWTHDAGTDRAQLTYKANA